MGKRGLEAFARPQRSWALTKIYPLMQDAMYLILAQKMLVKRVVSICQQRRRSIL